MHVGKKGNVTPSFARPTCTCKTVQQSIMIRTCIYERELIYPAPPVVPPQVRYDWTLLAPGPRSSHRTDPVRYDKGGQPRDIGQTEFVPHRSTPRPTVLKTQPRTPCDWRSIRLDTDSIDTDSSMDSISGKMDSGVSYGFLLKFNQIL